MTVKSCNTKITVNPDNLFPEVVASIEIMLPVQAKDDTFEISDESAMKFGRNIIKAITDTITNDEIMVDIDD